MCVYMSKKDQFCFKFRDKIEELNEAIKDFNTREKLFELYSIFKEAVKYHEDNYILKPIAKKAGE